MPRKRLYAYVGVMAAVLLATGCDQKSDSEKFSAYVEQAQQERDAGDLDAAAIHLKNALQIRPEHAQARRALGELHLARGQVNAAVKEFRRALDYGAPAEEVEPQLARAYLATGQAEKVLDLIPPEAKVGGALDPERLTIRGLALENLGKLDRAKAAFQAALKMDNRADAAVGLARVHMARNEAGPARTAVEQALEIAPDDQQAHFLKGRLLLADGETAKAQEVLSRLVDSDPPVMAAGVLLIESYLRQGAAEPAWALLDKLNGVYPDAPGVKLFSAIRALSSDDPEAAKRIADELVGRQPGFQRAQLVAGIANLRLGHNEQARANLRTYLNGRPDDAAARLMLAQALIRLDDDESARELLVEVDGPPASEMANLLRQAGADLPADRRTETYRLAAALENNQSEPTPEAMAAPEAGAGLQDTALQQSIMEAINEQRYDDAAEGIERLKQRQPNHHIPYKIEGLAYLAQGKPEQAEKALREARERAPQDEAVAYLLSLALQRQDKTSQAVDILDDALQASPGDQRLALAKARLHVSRGEADQLLSTLQNAIDENPKAVGARVYLGRFYLLNGAPGEAVKVLEPAREQSPDSAAVLEALGRAYQSQGQNQDAAAIFQHLASVAPERAEAHRLAGEALLRADKPASAVEYLRQAVDLANDQVEPRRLLAESLSQSGRLDEATDVIARLKEDFPDQPDVYVTSARHKIRADQDGSGALDDLKRARQLDPTAQRAMEVARLQVRMGQLDTAIDTLRAWISSHPDQPAAKRFLAELLLADNQYGEAISVYETVLQAGQDDVSLRNNLAWALTKAGRAEAALEHAKRAVEGAPDNPDVLDTYGAALLAAGRSEEAVEQLKAARSAAEARPDGALSPGIAFHLVDALLAIEDDESARDVLTALEDRDLSEGEQQKVDRYKEKLAP